MAAEVHAISKQDVLKHATFSVDEPSSPLAAGYTRIRSKLISITMNNMTYALLGSKLHWWDAYPIPSSAPAPFNDGQWGIVPAWGFGEVVESRTGIPKGALLFGFWPTSSQSVDLQLVRDEPEGRYREVSAHRQRLMSAYNRYYVAENDLSDETLAWKACVEPAWGCGYVMNRFCFASDSPERVHPSGTGRWTAEDADLNSAVMVVLAASSKTARSFTWNLEKRATGTGPLAVIKATTSPGQISNNALRMNEVRTVSYEALTSSETLEWIATFEPSRVIVVDFGGPSDVAQSFHDALFGSTPISKFTFVSVGASPQVLSSQDPRTEKFMFNTSPVIDAAIGAEGPEAFFENTSKAFRQSMDEKLMGQMELSWGNGIKGENSVEDAWKKLSTGKFPRDKALVFNIQSGRKQTLV